jgi:hypothetical protein
MIREPWNKYFYVKLCKKSLIFDYKKGFQFFEELFF